MPSARGQKGTHKGGLRPPLSLPPLKIPLLKPPAVRSGKFVWLFRLGMCRAERICKLSVYMITGAAYVPLHPFTEPEVHTFLRQPSALPGSKKRRRDFQRGEPWFTSLAPCEARLHRLPAQKKQTSHAQTTLTTFNMKMSR